MKSSFYFRYSKISKTSLTQKFGSVEKKSHLRLKLGFFSDRMNERRTSDRSIFFCDQLNERSLNFWRWSRSRSSITFCWSNGKSARGWVLHSFFFLLFSLIRSRPDSFHIKGCDFCPFFSLIFSFDHILLFRSKWPF